MRNKDMSFKKLPNVHTFIGGMTTDYFDFWCEKCGEHINRLKFHSEDVVGVKLEATCENVIKLQYLKLK